MAQRQKTSGLMMIDPDSGQRKWREDEDRCEQPLPSRRYGGLSAKRQDWIFPLLTNLPPRQPSIKPPPLILRKTNGLENGPGSTFAAGIWIETCRSTSMDHVDCLPFINIHHTLSAVTPIINRAGFTDASESTKVKSVPTVPPNISYLPREGEETRPLIAGDCGRDKAITRCGLDSDGALGFIFRGREKRQAITSRRLRRQAY
ncbi:hypothetical protein Bbelb_338960 [Branchiostoma belcheri]|nr:hypothetical protein Bbelb_338960 [Branchiostoma belcheri]